MAEVAGVTPRWTAQNFEGNADGLELLGYVQVAAMLRQAAESEKTLAKVRAFASEQLPPQYEALLLALLPPAGTR